MADKKEEKNAAAKPPQTESTLVSQIKNFAKMGGSLLAVWSLGYYQFSVAWGLIGIFFYMVNEEISKKNEKKIKFSKDIASMGEKKAIIGRVEELPSWVFFPDVERAEWLNRMIHKMWPYIGQYVEDILKTSVQPSVENSLPNSLKPFRFEKIDLGDVPPRIGGIKVYSENVQRDEIIIDMEITYASDTNIVVSTRGISAGIKDLVIQGHMRVVMKPLVKVIPIIGGLNVFFLNQPHVYFDLTAAANLLDMPMLKNTLRKVVADQISYFMVLPNKIPIQLTDAVNMETLKYPHPHGVLRLHVMAARELKAADVKLIGKGKSDPYCKVYIGAKTFKTKVISNSINPSWNSYFEAVVDQQHGQFVDMEVLDEDPGDDDELGVASLDISNVSKMGTVDTWLPLENVSTGMIHVRALWMYLSKNPKDLDKALAVAKNQKEEENNSAEEHLSSALLMVTVDSAEGLPRSKKSMSEPSPFVKIRLGNETLKSVEKARTTDPLWEENFQFLISDPRNQDINFEVVDANKSKKIGVVNVHLKNLLEAPELTMNRPFSLKDCVSTTAKLRLRLCLRVLTSEQPEEWARDKPLDIKTLTNLHLNNQNNPEGTSVDPPAKASVEEKKPTPAGAAVEEKADGKPPKDLPADLPAADKLDAGDPAAANNDTNGFYVGGDTSDTVSNTSSLAMEGMEIRQRASATSAAAPTSSPKDSNWGRVQLTLRYSTQRGRLIVVVHKCLDLLPCDDDDLADPYIKLYLLPDTSSKKKTQVVKNNLNPIFDETFDYKVSMSEAASRQLELTVKNQNSMFSKARVLMGVCTIDLSRINLAEPITEWFDLEDPDK